MIILLLVRFGLLSDYFLGNNCSLCGPYALCVILILVISVSQFLTCVHIIFSSVWVAE